MDTPSRSAGGLWNSAKPITYSQKTQALLKLLMQESHLANVQKRQIRECLKNGAPLRLACASRSSLSPAPSKPSRSTTRHLSNKPQRRSAEMCKAGESYVREKFRPGPTRDLEKEKRRLQNILEMGKDAPTVTVESPRNVQVPEEKERFDQILDEIEERRQFLEDMASLGKEQEYVNIINSEISQRIRELEIINKPERKLDSANEEKSN